MQTVGAMCRLDAFAYALPMQAKHDTSDGRERSRVDPEATLNVGPPAGRPVSEGNKRTARERAEPPARANRVLLAGVRPDRHGRAKGFGRALGRHPLDHGNTPFSHHATWDQSLAVSCTPPGSCIADGYFHDAVTGRGATLIEAWNGTTWQPQSSGVVEGLNPNSCSSVPDDGSAMSPSAPRSRRFPVKQDRHVPPSATSVSLHTQRDHS